MCYTPLALLHKLCSYESPCHWKACPEASGVFFSLTEESTVLVSAFVALLGRLGCACLISTV